MYKLKFCTYCGKEIADQAVICLNCGCKTPSAINTAYAQPVSQTQQILIEEEESQLAVSSKICGIISFFVGWFVLGITAIVLAVMSKDDTNGQMCESAKVGFVCGIISTALSLVLLVVLVAIIVALG